MRLSIFPKSLLRQCRLQQFPRNYPSRAFHAATRLEVVKPFLLADIGEGIRECEIIQWFVEPNARVEEFDKICEVQSDKASVEITTRFTGVIKKLHYESGEMAIVGKPLVDIDVQEDAEIEEAEPPRAKEGGDQENFVEDVTSSTKTNKTNQDLPGTEQTSSAVWKGTHASLATPAIRHLTKELNVNISDVSGTGRDGRVLKEDVYKFAEARDSGNGAVSGPSRSPPSQSSPSVTDGAQKETSVPLTNMQSQMFKTMTRSLSIPHFLYADEIDFSNLSALRQRLNKSLAVSHSAENISKLSFLPFIIKAVSLALHQYPILNARVDTTTDASKPAIITRFHHNIGVAMDTPAGLLVPVIKNVSTLTIPSIAAELTRLQSLASTGKLSAADLSGGTISVSNIGSIGGTYVAPVCVDKEVAILGVGKMRTVPAFAANGSVVPKQVCNFSWSADHRIVDGATLARAAEVVRGFVEQPDGMLVHLR